VHNGIEYADMQLIAEAYDLLRRVGGHSPAAIAEIFAEWNTGDLESYLIEITAEVLRQIDAKTGKPFVDIVLDEAGSKGTGVWTVQSALDLGVPVGGIAEAVFARAVSSHPEQRGPVRAVIDARPEIAVVGTTFQDDVRAALYASKVVAYAQGFDAIIAGAKQYNWDIDKGAIAKIWRGGCIIRAQFLNRIVEAYENNPDIPTLLVDPYFATAVTEGEAAWRRIVSTAALSGIPVPGFGAALSYYDSLASERLPAALVQGQRDFFGAHTYKRTDAEGYWHTRWSQDGTEVAAGGQPRSEASGSTSLPAGSDRRRASPTPGRSRSSGPTPTRGPPSSQADASVEPSGRPKGNQPNTPHTPRHASSTPTKRGPLR
jgi:6-phosphogluconate dehydrogenase